MGALVSSPWLTWALLGFGPSAAVLVLGMRALIRDTAESWADFRDMNGLLDWLMPGLAVLAVMPLARLRLSGSEPTIVSAGPILVYILAAWLPGWTAQRKDAPMSPLKAARMLVAANAGPISVACFLAVRAVASPELIGGMPTLRLFVNLFLAKTIGEWALSWLAGGVGRWERLAPGDLYKRVVEIAAKSRVEVGEVRILRAYPTGYVGALAHSGNCISFGEELITKLNRDEVDAVIAHEVGHLADKAVWFYSYPAQIIAALAWYGSVRHLERAITALPAGLRDLQYLNWLAMFILPGLVWRAFSRHSERKADANVAVLDNPLAAISGYFKLHVLNQVPIDRPWWSRMLSTHPTLRKDILTIARRSGLPAEQIEEARRRAAVEAETGPTDPYELIYHSEAESEAEKRGGRPVEIALGVLAVLVACTFMFGSFYFAVLTERPGWQVAAIVGAGVVAAGLAVLLPIHLYNRRRDRALEERLRAKLASRYGGEAASSMLMVDVQLMEDEGVWQGALIGTRDGNLVVLAETREVSVPLGTEFDVDKLNDENSIGNQRMIYVRYEMDSVHQWIILRLLGRPEKGLPRNRNELARHIRELIAGGGGSLEAREKPPARQVLVRAPIALLALAAVFGLTDLLLRLAGLRGMWFVHGMVLFSVGAVLHAWVIQSPGSANDPEE